MKRLPRPYDFSESFEGYVERCGLECTCAGTYTTSLGVTHRRAVVAWEHQIGCPHKVGYDAWKSHGLETWTLIKSLPNYVPWVAQ